MKRKKFILIVLMFLFINILSMSAENPTTIVVNYYLYLM